MTYKFTPTLKNPDELKATLVAQQPLIDDLIKKIRASSKGVSLRHHILIGPRGIGKTHIVLLIYYTIKQDTELNKHLIPIKFSEEEYSINRISDFFLRILEELLHEEYSRKLDELIKKLKSSSEQEIVEFSLDFLRNFKKKTHKRILLFIENLNLVFKQIDDKAELGRLREVLMKDDFLMIIGTAPTIFKGIVGYEEPFYNFFEIEHLPELKPDDVVDLFRKRAGYDGNEEVLRNFNKYVPRIKAICHITGGNPRLILIFYDILTEGDIAEIEKEFEKLLDELTPYYQAKIEALPTQQRKIFDTLALMDGAATPTEIAKEARIGRSSVITQLKRLGERGYVRPVKQERRKKIFYDITERIFRIWREMRTLKGRTRVGFLVRLLKIWYTPKELDKECIRLKTVCDEFYRDGAIDRVKSIITHLEYLQEAVPLEEGFKIHTERITKLLDIGEFIEAEKEIEKFRDKAVKMGSVRHIISSYLPTVTLGLMTGDFKKGLDAIDKILSFDSYLSTSDDFHSSVLYVRGSLLWGLGKSEDAIENLNKALELNPKNSGLLSLIWYAKGKASMDLGKSEDAIENLNKALELNPKNADIWHDTGLSLIFLHKPEKAMESFNRALELNPREPELLSSIWYSKGLVSGFLSNFEDALESFNRALELNPREPESLFYRALSLFNLNQYDKAIKDALKSLHISEEIGQRKNTLRTTLWLSFANASLEKYRKAETYLRKALAIEVDEEELQGNIVFFIGDLIAESQIDFSKKALEIIENVKGEDYANLLNPYYIALNYLESRDAEILDRLHPEVREIVEEIIEKTKKSK